MTDDRFLQDQIALVTGGGRGIGRTIALALGAAGAHVFVAGRTAKALEDSVLAIEARGGAASPFPCDLTEEQSILDLFACIDGRGGLDILVNNAGIGTFKPLAETSTADWDQVMNVNLRGAFLCGREAMRRMAPEGGRIINIGSVVSLKGYANQGAYTASKHGLLGLTKVMAAEGQAAGIVVQAICPGGVDTEMVAQSRPDLDRALLMTPEDIAQAVLFLLRQRDNAVTDLVQLRRRTSPPFA